MTEKPFQDQGSVAHCYGCGADNEKGFRIKSYWDGDETICTWQPSPHHCAGSENILNGGVIASLIDCHSINTAIAHHYKTENRPIGSSPLIYVVTASLNVTYLRAVDISKPIKLRARLVKNEGRKSWIESTLSSEGEICAEGKVLAVRKNNS